MGMWTESTAKRQENNGQQVNVLREDYAFENLRSVSDINDFHSWPMSESESETMRLTITRNAPVYSITIKDAQYQNGRLDSPRTNGTSPQDVLSVRTDGVSDDHSSVLTYAGILSQHNDLQLVDRTQTSSIAQYVDSPEEFSSRSAILQTTVAVRESVVSSSSMSLLVVLTILGSMFFCSMVFTSSLAFSLATFVFAQSVQYLASLRESCNEWIGNDVFTTAKLALCAVMATQLPIPTESNLLCGGATLFHLLTGTQVQMASEKLMTSNGDVDREDGCANTKGMLGMMMDLSPIVTV